MHKIIYSVDGRAPLASSSLFDPMDDDHLDGFSAGLAACDAIQKGGGAPAKEGTFIVLLYGTDGKPTHRVTMRMTLIPVYAAEKVERLVR